MSKRAGQMLGPSPLSAARGGKRRKVEPPPSSAGYLSTPGYGASQGGQGVRQTGAPPAPAVKPAASTQQSQQSNPEVQQRNQVAMQMLKMLLPSPGPYAQLDLANLPHLHPRLCRELEGRHRQQVHHALNSLNLASFEWRTGKAVQLAQLVGLAPLLVELGLEGLASTVPDKYSEASPTRSSGPFPLAKHPQTEWQEAGQWWWNQDEDLFLDQQDRVDRLTWTTAVTNILRNLSLHEHNRSPLLDAGVLHLVDAVLQQQLMDPSPLYNELAANMLDMLQHVAPVMHLPAEEPELPLVSAPPPAISHSSSPPSAPHALPPTIIPSASPTKLPDNPPEKPATDQMLPSLLSHLKTLLLETSTPLRLKALVLRVLRALCQRNAQQVMRLLLLGVGQLVEVVVELTVCTEDVAREAAGREAEGEMNYLDVIKVEELTPLELELLALHMQADTVEAATQLVSTLLTAARRHPLANPLECPSIPQGPITAPDVAPHRGKSSHRDMTGDNEVTADKNHTGHRGSTGDGSDVRHEADPQGRVHTGGSGIAAGVDKASGRREDGGERGAETKLGGKGLLAELLVRDARLVRYLVKASRKRWPSLAARHGTHLSKLQDRTKHPLLYSGAHLADMAAATATATLRTIAEDALLRPALKPHELALALDAMSNGPFAEAYTSILSML